MELHGVICRQKRAPGGCESKVLSNVFYLCDTRKKSWDQISGFFHTTLALFPAGLSAVEFGQSISVCLLHECIDSYVHAFMYGGVYV